MITVDRKCRCKYCHWYRPRKGQRCWGFNEEDIKECMENDYGSFKGRDTKILKKIRENMKND